MSTQQSSLLERTYRVPVRVVARAYAIVSALSPSDAQAIAEQEKYALHEDIDVESVTVTGPAREDTR